MNPREKLNQLRKDYEDNRTMNAAMEKQVRVIVRDEAKKIVDQNVRFRIVLKRIIDDLPTNRDWLDPDLEAEAKLLLAEPMDPEVSDPVVIGFGKTYGERSFNNRPIPHERDSSYSSGHTDDED